MSPTIQASSNENMCTWDRQGLLVRPADTYESYSLRTCRFLEGASSSQNSPAMDALWRLYKIDPSWIQVTYSNKGLRAWEAGCTWYSDDPEEMATVQLKEAFLRTTNYLGLYAKDEVLAHEFVHVVRAPLGSKLFEEIFSYLVSLEFCRGSFHRALCRFRVALGPLFSSPRETVLFLCLFASSLFWGFGASLAVFALFCLRLAYRWWQWLRCKHHLQELYEQQALALMVRLTDEEIILFSKLKPRDIASWIAKEKENNFRWCCLDLAILQR